MIAINSTPLAARWRFARAEDAAIVPRNAHGGAQRRPEARPVDGRVRAWLVVVLGVRIGPGEVQYARKLGEVAMDGCDHRPMREELEDDCLAGHCSLTRSKQIGEQRWREYEQGAS